MVVVNIPGSVLAYISVFVCNFGTIYFDLMVIKQHIWSSLLFAKLMPNYHRVHPVCSGTLISCFADVWADKLEFPVSNKRNPCTAVTKGVMLIVYHISVWDSKVIVVLFPLLLCVKPLQTRAFTTRQELCMMQKSSQEKDSGDPFSFVLSLLELSSQVPKKSFIRWLKNKSVAIMIFLKVAF